MQIFSEKNVFLLQKKRVFVNLATIALEVNEYFACNIGTPIYIIY